MLKKSKVYITVLLFVLCMLCGCAKRTEVKNDDSFIYSVNGERNGLVKINYDFRGKTTEEQVNNVIKELQKPAEEINYSTTFSVLYTGTIIDSMISLQTKLSTFFRASLIN